MLIFSDFNELKSVLQGLKLFCMVLVLANYINPGSDLPRYQS